jgi:hypothetical protein
MKLQSLSVLALAVLLAGCSAGKGETVNLALDKAAYASSSYDYNLTAQLATDGEVQTSEPAWLSVSSSEGEFPRREKEWTIDGAPFSRNVLHGESDFLEYSWSSQKFSAKCLRIVGKVYFTENAGGWTITCSTGNGEEMKTVGKAGGAGLPSAGVTVDDKVNDPNKESGTIDCKSCPMYLQIPLDGADSFSRMRLDFSMHGAVEWDITSVSLTEEKRFSRSRDTGPYFSKKARGMNLMPSEEFTSAWMSADGNPQWIYVDLGEVKKFSGVNLFWLHKPQSCVISVSDDAETWEDMLEVPQGDGLSDSLKIKGKARYVKLSVQGADSCGRFVLSEMEVMGKSVGNQDSSAEGQQGWKLCRSSFISASGEEISSPSYNDSAWMPAVVPGTVLYSYIADGAVPDPSVGDNMLQISESYFNSDFWYRGMLKAPEKKGGRTLLTFDGINWKAEVYVNGTMVGDIKGAFMKKSFDITGLVKDVNCVAVHVVKPENFGAVKEKNAESPDFNGGMLGADNPTFHATVGWDWIPTVRGRDMGIWNDVRLESAGDVVLRNPLVSTKLNLPDTLASMTFSVDVENLSDSPVTGRLAGTIDTISFSKEISVGADTVETVTFSPEDFPQLKDRKIALWWPVGYGNPALHESSFEFSPQDGSEACRIGFKAGIREFDYQDTDTALKIYVNGHRMTPKGGNWGFSEFNLRFGEKEYDTALALHKEMNFNMIRNWVGQTGDDEFYDACDKYGVVVWQDFWLANPADGPDPDDFGMFLDNARDMVSRIRRHPSVGLYCGRNEGYPPAELDAGLKKIVAELHPGILYIPNSADDGVSGHGPYCALPAEYYFRHRSGKLHSERGMPSIPVYGDLSRMLTEDHLGKPDDVWGQHDFTATGALYGSTLLDLVRKGFGEEALSDAESFAKYAQFICYNGYRAMFEANNVDRNGLLLWMSHSAWPSMAWQTYDYWFTKNGAFYGSMLGAEPLHIQFNPLALKAQAVNTGIGGHEGMNATVRLLDPEGKVIYSKEATFDIGEDETVDAVDMSDVPDGSCIMVLSLTDASGKEISHNEYAMDFSGGHDSGDYGELAETIEESLSKIPSKPLLSLEKCLNIASDFRRQ